MPHQGGTAVRCWSCQREVLVPYADPTGRLVRDLGEAASGVLADPALLGGAAVLTAALLVPTAGPWLGLVGLAVAFGRGYGGQVKAGALAPEPSGPPLRVARVLLAALAALALVAPLIVRNGGYALPPDSPTRNAAWMAALALSGWAVMPIALLAAHAYGGRSPGRALAALAHRPLATLAALLIVPAGLLAVEAVVAGLAWEQGQLPMLVGDLFPPPRFEQRIDGPYLIFDLDGTVIGTNVGASMDVLTPIYRKGLRRGFTLTGTIPVSLSMGSVLRQPLWMYRVPSWQYLTMRIVLTILIVWAVGVLVIIQARWLGVIAASDPRGATHVPDPGPPEIQPSGGLVEKKLE